MQKNPGKDLRYLPLLLLLLAICTAVLWVAWNWSYRDALEQLENEGEGRLALASDRLVGQLDKYRQLPVIMTANPILQEALSGDGLSMNDLDLFLEHQADITGALDILLIDRKGIAVATANWREDDSYRGVDFSGRADFQRAMNGALGFYHSQENADDPRGFYFTSAVRSAGVILGAIMIKVDLEEIEVHWRGDPENIFFTDKSGVVFISNRDSLIMNVFVQEDVAQTTRQDLRRYSIDQLRPSPEVTIENRFDREVWQIDEHADLPQNALYLRIPLPIIGMTGNILIDLAAVEQEARLRTTLVASVLALLMVTLLVLAQRRRILSGQLQIEENAKIELEKRVVERTAQLSSANKNLSSEVAERTLAEEALRKAQDNLVQAGKLAALGQMSASISHELNQPLAAIQSYAENAVILLERERKAEAQKNLSQISSMAARMGRIIRNLRAFAKKEGEAPSEVDLVHVVNDAIEIAGISLRNQSVTVHWQQPVIPVTVIGGGVRLQQVVLNLITNAIDVLEMQQDRQIWLDILQTNKKILLKIRDNGPGLEDKSKIFEPFYTTKTVENGDGMGLGLSISYGIVQSFGGDISGENHPAGGAVFTIELDRPDMEAEQ